MLKRQRVDVSGMFVSFAVVLASLLLLTSCTTFREAGAWYTDNLADKIPSVKVQGHVGGSGLGASFGLESKWTGDKRERVITVGPDVDVDKLKESLEDEQ